jgi:predicted esterase
MSAVNPGPHAGQRVVARGKPLGEGRVTVILIHGRNASPESILELVPALDCAEASYLAPAAAGGTWYPFGFMSPVEKNEPGISSGIAVVHGLIEQAAAKGVPAERIVLLGFSQGACLASTAAQRRPAHYGGVIVYSGGLIGPPGSSWNGEGDFGGAAAFFGCSDRDPHIPEERVRASAAVFERMGATVTLRIYPHMGHLVNGDEIAFTRDLLAALAAT